MTRLQYGLFFSLLLFSLSSFAQSRVALVIGNSDYQGNHFLKNPVNDAKAIANVLDKQGFEVMTVYDASRSQMKTAMDKFAQRLNNQTVGLFFYAGHGVQNRGRNYLIPIGGMRSIKAPGHFQDEAVSVKYLLDMLDFYGSAMNIVILDACRSSPFPSEFREYQSQQGLINIKTPKGTLIAYATAEGDVADDGADGDHSPYTKQLLHYMQQPNNKIEEVLKNVAEAVQKDTQNLQNPIYKSSIVGDFYFQFTAIPPKPTDIILSLRSNVKQGLDQVFINDKAYGATPLQQALPVGLHYIKIQAQGYQDYEKELELTQSYSLYARLDKTAVVTPPAVKKVIATSKPSKAGKTIDRYIAYDDGTALDTVTNLIWMRCSVGQTWTGKSCEGKVKTFNWEDAKQQTADFAGFSDWRIPTIEELRTLTYCSNGKPAYFNQGKLGIDEYIKQGKSDSFDLGCQGEPEKDHESPTIMRAVFPNTPSGWPDGVVWSGSPVAGYPYLTWIVSFYNGYDDYGRRARDLAVRLVRGRQ